MAQVEEDSCYPLKRRYLHGLRRHAGQHAGLVDGGFSACVNESCSTRLPCILLHNRLSGQFVGDVWCQVSALQCICAEEEVEEGVQRNFSMNGFASTDSADYTDVLQCHAPQ